MSSDDERNFEVEQAATTPESELAAGLVALHDWLGRHVNLAYDAPETKKTLFNVQLTGLLMVTHGGDVDDDEGIIYTLMHPELGYVCEIWMDAIRRVDLTGLKPDGTGTITLYGESSSAVEIGRIA